MKINLFTAIISLVVCGLLFWGLYSQYDDAGLLPTIGTSVVAFVFLATTLAVSLPDAKRSGALIKIISALFFIVMLVVDAIFTRRGVSAPTFVVTNGIVLCIWAILIYGVARTKQ